MRKKKKTICVVGQTYDMDVAPLDWVKEQVQKDLVYIYGAGKIKFDMTIDSDDSYRLIFKRHYGSYYEPNYTKFPNDKEVFAGDVQILLGTLREDHPNNLDLEHINSAYVPYYFMSNVLEDYRKASKTWGSAVVQGLDVEEAEDGESVTFIVKI